MHQYVFHSYLALTLFWVIRMVMFETSMQMITHFIERVNLCTYVCNNLCSKIKSAIFEEVKLPDQYHRITAIGYKTVCSNRSFINLFGDTKARVCREHLFASIQTWISHICFFGKVLAWSWAPAGACRLTITSPHSPPSYSYYHHYIPLGTWFVRWVTSKQCLVNVEMFYVQYRHKPIYDFPCPLCTIHICCYCCWAFFVSTSCCVPNVPPY